MQTTAAGVESDEALMVRLQSGDESALGALMERWELPLKRFTFRLLLNETEAEEIAQETMVRVFQQRAKYRGESRFSPWVLTIAANLARNRRRWWRRHPTVSLSAPAGGADGGEDVSDWELPDESLGPAERVQRSESAKRVRAAVAALPHDLRELVVLCEFEERSQAEVAEILGCTVKAVEMRMYRAREKLRALLKRKTE